MRGREVSTTSRRDLLRSDAGSALSVTVWAVLGIVVVVTGAIVVFALNAGKSTPTANGFDAAAFKSAMSKAGVSAPDLTEPVDASKVRFTGTKPLDAEFTDAELSAMINAVVAPSVIPVTNVSVKLHAGSTGDATGEGLYKGKWYTGWIKGPVAISGNEITSSGNTGYGVAGVPVPLAQYKQKATDYVLDFLNAHLAIVTGLKIDKVEVSEGKVRVTGTVPATMVVVK